MNKVEETYRQIKMILPLRRCETGRYYISEMSVASEVCGLVINEEPIRSFRVNPTLGVCDAWEAKPDETGDDDNG